MHGGKRDCALRPTPTTVITATTVSVGSALALVGLAGCAGGTPSVDYLDSPTRVQAPTSDVSNRAYDDPVYPTNVGPSATTDDVCDLVSAADVEQVTGVQGVSATPASQVLCTYQADGRGVFRLTLHSYPESTEPETVLEATVSPYAEIEVTPDVGDAAAYVADTGDDLPPSLFVAEGVDDGVAVLTLAFDDEGDAKDQLIALGEVATAEL